MHEQLWLVNLMRLRRMERPELLERVRQFDRPGSAGIEFVLRDDLSCVLQQRAQTFFVKTSPCVYRMAFRDSEACPKEIGHA